MYPRALSSCDEIRKTQENSLTHLKYDNITNTGEMSSVQYEEVKNPKGYLKRGRIFETPENGQRYVVLQPGSTSSVCLPISTDSVEPNDGQSHQDTHGATSSETSMEVILEGDSALDPGWRINYDKRQQIDHRGVKVRNIGRLAPASIHLMNNKVSLQSQRSSPYSEPPGVNYAQMPPPVPLGQRSSLPNLISGTPQTGWYETLDSS